MSSTTEVSICNVALDRLGQRPITSLESDDSMSRRCQRLYPLYRDKLLGMHPWHFACWVIYLSPILPDSSPFEDTEYTNIYLLPSDCIRILSVSNLDISEYQRRGKYLSANAENVVKLDYLRRVEDPQVFDSSFALTLSTALAMALFSHKADSKTVLQDLRGEFIAALAEAKRVNGLESPPILSEDDTWVNARL
ncbi:MAG: hypothetical protein LPH21_12555 [Shewanella sp.]|nr:hypothetical protein [Shewanella sp.]